METALAFRFERGVTEPTIAQTVVVPRVGGQVLQGDLEGDEFDIEVKRYSKAYFQLLENDKSLGRYLGLGENVRIQIGNQVVQISDAGLEHLNSSQLRELFPN